MANWPPGWEAAVSAVSPSAEVTAVPLTEVITSPPARPAVAAG